MCTSLTLNGYLTPFEAIEENTHSNYYVIDGFEFVGYSNKELKLVMKSHNYHDSSIRADYSITFENIEPGIEYYDFVNEHFKLIFPDYRNLGEEDIQMCNESGVKSELIYECGSSVQSVQLDSCRRPQRLKRMPVMKSGGSSLSFTPSELRAMTMARKERERKRQAMIKKWKSYGQFEVGEYLCIDLVKAGSAKNTAKAKEILQERAEYEIAKRIK